MKKSKGASTSSIFSLWDKASKAKKTDDTSTPNQTIAATSPSSDCPVQLENNLQLPLVQEPVEATPIVEDVEASDDDDDDDEPVEADLGALEHDPGKRISISSKDCLTPLETHQFSTHDPCVLATESIETVINLKVFLSVWYGEN